MADTVTQYYNLVKPEVGGSQDTWGAKLNSNFDIIDQLLSGGVSGWGATNTNVNVPNDDADALRTNGVWRTYSGTVGAPDYNNALGQLLHMGQGANYAVQVWFPTARNLTRMYRRALIDNEWTDWIPLAGTIAGRDLTISASNPSGGVDGDVWFKI